MVLGALRVQVVPKTHTNWYLPPLRYTWGGGGPGVAVWGSLGHSHTPCLADEKKRTPPSLAISKKIISNKTPGSRS